MPPIKRWFQMATLVASLAPAVSAQQVFLATITADNSYAVYVGDADGVTTFIGHATNSEAEQIFSPEVYSLPVADDGWIYVAAWSDDMILQGLLSQFANLTLGGSVLSGAPLWQVTATGINLGLFSQPPTVSQLTEQIGLANAGTNPSGGWVAPTSSPSTNGQGGIHEMFVAGIDPLARWIWYDSGTDPRASAPFIGFNHQEYLIFRMPAVPEPGASGVALLCLAVAIACRHRRRR